MFVVLHHNAPGQKRASTHLNSVLHAVEQKTNQIRLKSFFAKINLLKLDRFYSPQFV